MFYVNNMCVKNVTLDILNLFFYAWFPEDRILEQKLIKVLLDLNWELVFVSNSKNEFWFVYCYVIFKKQVSEVSSH